MYRYCILAKKITNMWMLNSRLCVTKNSAALLITAPPHESVQNSISCATTYITLQATKAQTFV
jgi:hypothetical protein